MKSAGTMKFGALLRVETARLFKSRAFLAVLALTVLAPAAGISLYRGIPGGEGAAYSTSVTGKWIGNPALAGALFGVVIFGIWTVLEFDKVRKFGVEHLTDVLVSPLRAGLARTAGLLILAVVVQVVVLLFWLPITMAKVGNVFRMKWYISIYLTVMLAALCFAVVLVSAIYQIFRRLDLTILLLIALVLCSLIVWGNNWLLRWVNPPIAYLSDDFGNNRRIFSLLWNRLFWSTVISGIWLVSFLCIRRYGKGLPGSFVKNIRKFWLPAAAVILLAAGSQVYAKQPFIDHSKLEYDDNFTFTVDDEETVTYSSIDLNLKPDLKFGRLFGTAVYQMHNSSGKPQTVSFAINPGYRFSSVTANGKAAGFHDQNDDDQNEKTIQVELPADEIIELVIEYGGFARDWNIMEMAQGEKEISSDYIYLANQDLCPAPDGVFWSTDGLPPLRGEIVLPDGMKPVLFGNGKVFKEGIESGNRVRWRFEDKGPYAILYAGDYVTEQIQTADIALEFYYSKKHERIMEECEVKEVLKKVFEYCTSHYGAFKFYGEEGMKLLEIGAFGGGYASKGASAMSEDSFQEEGLKDPLKGAGGNEVMTHEIVHQWWGIGNMFDSETEEDGWSSEGLTVYTTYRMMKEKYGEEYAKKHYVDIWQRETDNYYKNFYVRNPQFLKQLPEKFRADIVNSVSQVRRYCEMPLKILKAEQLVGGEAAMDQILGGLFTREVDNSYPYLTYQNFLDACGLGEEELRLE